MPRRYYSSTAVETTLTSNVSNSATTLPVASTSGFPGSTPYTLILDEGTVNEEIVTVTGVASLNLTVTRGVDGTTAVSHSNGATVKHGVSARDFDEANSHVNDTTTDVHSQYVTKALIANSKGALITSTGSAVAALSVGTNDHILTADSTAPNGIKWAAAPASGIPATLLDAKGDLIVATADNTAARLAVGTNGHALVADSGATAGVKWAAVGKVLQVVSTAKTDTFTTTATTYTEVTGLTATITPSSTSSKILVTVSLVGQRSAANNQVGHASVFRGSTNLVDASSPSSRIPSFTSGLQMGDTNGDVNLEVYSYTYLDSPSTTSATTYGVRVRVVSGSPETFYVNRTESDTDGAARGRGVSTITVMEIGA
jgi:hypothetical protein